VGGGCGASRLRLARRRVGEMVTVAISGSAVASSCTSPSRLADENLGPGLVRRDGPTVSSGGAGVEESIGGVSAPTCFACVAVVSVCADGRPPCCRGGPDTPLAPPAAPVGDVSGDENTSSTIESALSPR
jgi:hypothetical protein